MDTNGPQVKEKKTTKKSMAQLTDMAGEAVEEVLKPKATTKVKLVEIPGIKVRAIKIPIKGITELIMKGWSQEAVDKIAGKQAHKPESGGQEARDPEAEYLASMHTWEEGPKKKGYCFPASAFKQAAVRAAKNAKFAMTDARAAFFVIGDCHGGSMVKLKCSKPYMRIDTIRNPSTKGGGIAYRPGFAEWSCVLNIEFDLGIINEEQLANLFNRAGFGTGIGEWRPERNGINGRFRVGV